MSKTLADLRNLVSPELKEKLGDMNVVNVVVSLDLLSLTYDDWYSGEWEMKVIPEERVRPVPLGSDHSRLFCDSISLPLRPRSL